MKKFEVEFKKTSWVMVTVEATSEEDAENKAFEQLEADGLLKGACWDIDGVWEIKAKEQA